MNDTSIVKITDSTTVISSKNEHIILIQDLKKEPIKGWYESPWIASFLMPVLVAAFVAWFTNRINKKKNQLEIDKLKEETSNLKRSFQPIVIGTLQSIQDKIIESKIEALKTLVEIKNKFTYHEQQYYEGEPVTPGYSEYLDLLFYNFSNANYESYNNFHNKYSYLFPDNVFGKLKELQSKLSSMNETKKSFNSIADEDTEIGDREQKEIEQIIKLFDDAILAIRNDCHLNTSLIHEFIEQNK